MTERERSNPITVFDSGVGSYSIVRVLQAQLPGENIVYFADRASFPYGQKTHDELRDVVAATIALLEADYHPKLIVIASNTPSIQVLDELTGVNTLLVGVFPPVEKAAQISKTKQVAILATKGAVESSEIDDFIKQKGLPPAVTVHKVNASPLVALIEPGTFQSDPESSKATIRSVIDPVLSEYPDIDVMTLSSTHLPFLYDYLVDLYPNITFLDPAEEVAAEVKTTLQSMNQLADGEDGTIKVITTVDVAGTLNPQELQNILSILGLQTTVETI